MNRRHFKIMDRVERAIGEHKLQVDRCNHADDTVKALENALLDAKMNQRAEQEVQSQRLKELFAAKADAKKRLPKSLQTNGLYVLDGVVYKVTWGCMGLFVNKQYAEVVK